MIGRFYNKWIAPPMIVVGFFLLLSAFFNFNFLNQNHYTGLILIMMLLVLPTRHFLFDEEGNLK